MPRGIRQRGAKAEIGSSAVPTKLCGASAPNSLGKKRLMLTPLQLKKHKNRLGGAGSSAQAGFGVRLSRKGNPTVAPRVPRRNQRRLNESLGERVCMASLSPSGHDG